MSSLLIPCEPLQVLPSLAKAIGLNEAIFLQQLHYWLLRSKHERDGAKWVFNTYEEWQSQFPFWSTRTIKRIVADLTSKGVLKVRQLGPSKWDHRNWYSIDYEVLETVCTDFSPPSKGTKSHNQDSANLPPSYKDQEITTETTNTPPLSPKPRRSHKPPEPEIVLDPPYHSREFLKGLEKYRQVRREMNSPLTPTMTEELYAKLAQYPEEACVRALREAAAGGYKGVFPERECGHESVEVEPPPRRQTIAERLGITDEEAGRIAARTGYQRNETRAN